MLSNFEGWSDRVKDQMAVYQTGVMILFGPLVRFHLYSIDFL